MWRYLRTLPPEYQAFYHITDAFEDFIGEPPKSLAHYLQEHKDSVRTGGSTMSDEPSATSASTYVLGHADVEIERLLLQARLYDKDTEHALRLAGLRPGMRVLDVGCGPV